jgi:hypothetical protein
MTLRKLFLLALVTSPLASAVALADSSSDAFVKEARTLVMNSPSVRAAVQKRPTPREGALKSPTENQKTFPAPSH